MPPLSHLPPELSGLADVAYNLSWSWNRDARTLLRLIDEPVWHLTRHNPIALLESTSAERLRECAADPVFMEQYRKVMAWREREAKSDGTWFERTWPGHAAGPVAYFCAEFGFHSSVPIYSGGLGVLAGDHIKTSSDLGVPTVGVGLFYLKGYFDQRVRLDGWQEDSDETFDVANTPLRPVPGPGGKPYLATVMTFGRPVHIRAWRMHVGRVPIYLLDTNLEENDPADRALLSKLYAGGPDLRLRQEWLLGVGGVRVLRALGIHPAAWHANEGHAAFMLLERLREQVGQGAAFGDAVARVRASSIFTTHTPVPAGHDAFTHDQVVECSSGFWNELGVSREAMLGLGCHPVRDHGLFHMSVLAIRLSSRVNGVSRVHGAVSRDLWKDLWPGRAPDSVPIGHVTNGVHLATWMANPVMELLDRHLGPDWGARQDDPALWDQVLDLDDAGLWEVHFALKKVLFNLIREEARRGFTHRWSEAAQVVGAGTLLDPNAFTIGFARRFATYKRSDLIFRDVERLRRLLTDPWRPVQIVFAGKAHPADTPGKEMLRSVYRFTRDPRFEGRVAFVEDYDMHVAHTLVQGVDLWLNLPRVPLEASGTSGMKAALNGVPQLSTLDGWWAEGYTGDNGWAIPVATDPDRADQADADALYTLLEREVVPLFYDRDASGLPRGWIRRMKQAMRVVGQRFTTQRMLCEYVRDYYLPAMGGDLSHDDPPTG
ncbi:MAG: alpha-glucan family phosphorylase [Gemmatimonadota bacterium]